MSIEFKNNVSEVEYKGARVVMEKITVVDDIDNIYIFDMAGNTLKNIDKFIAAGCPGDTVEEYGGTLL